MPFCNMTPCEHIRTPKFDGSVKTLEGSRRNLMVS
jgi:hypothetical protein